MSERRAVNTDYYVPPRVIKSGQYNSIGEQDDDIVDPNWRNAKLSQDDLIVLATSTTKSYVELGLPRSPSNYGEVMRLNQLKIDEQCKIARNRGLPIVLGRVSPDVIRMAKARLRQMEQATA